MSLATKILISIGSFLVLAALAFICYKQVEISTRQQAIEAQVISQKQLVDGIVRSQSSWATKDDVDKFIKDNGLNLKAIQEDLDKLHAEITAATTIVVDSHGQYAGNLPSTNTGGSNPKPSDAPDPYGYLAKQQNLAINEDFGTVKVPIGSVGFSAWQAAPWNIDIKAREYHVSNVVGTDENQKISVYSKFAVKVDGKTYDVPIKTAVTQQVYPTAKFSVFNPRLFLSTNSGVGVRTVQGEFTPSVNVGIMSYGKYKTQPDFSVLQVGVGFGVVSRKPQVLVSPGAYNVGQHIPLMRNLYIGPTIGIGTDGNVFIMGSLAVAL